QNERQCDGVLTAQPVQIEQTLADCLSLDDECVGGELRTPTPKLIEDFQLRFSDKSTSRDSRICRSWDTQAAISNCQQRVVDTYGDVKQPRRPKLPTRPTPHAYRGGTEFSQNKKR